MVGTVDTNNSSMIRGLVNAMKELVRDRALKAVTATAQG
jgi:hypothetical protein